jgi:hypothetical protein
VRIAEVALEDDWTTINNGPRGSGLESNHVTLDGSDTVAGARNFPA